MARPAAQASPPRPARRGFTLIELLVVMVILLLLIALLLPVVNSAIAAGRRAQVGAEINAMATALAQFKSTYGDYPPSRMYLNETGYYPVSSAVPLAGGYPGAGISDITWGQLAQRSLQAMRKFWPRAAFSSSGTVFAKPSTVWQDLNGDGVFEDFVDYGGSLTTPPYGGCIIEGHQCLVWFLGGIPNFDPVAGVPNGVSGFGKNPANPFSNNISIDPRFNNGPNPMFANNRTVPLFEFKGDRLVSSKVDSLGNPLTPFGFPGYYDTIGSKTDANTINFYTYFSAYGGAGYDPNDVNFVEHDQQGSGTTFPITLTFNSGVTGTITSQSPNPYTSSRTVASGGSVQFQNPQSFQILSSGGDGIYGVGGQYAGPSSNQRLPLDPSLPYNSPDGSLRVVEKDNITNFASGKLD